MLILDQGEISFKKKTLSMSLHSKLIEESSRTFQAPTQKFWTFSRINGIQGHFNDHSHVKASANIVSYSELQPQRSRLKSILCFSMIIITMDWRKSRFMVTRVGANEVIKASLKLNMKPQKSAESKLNPNKFYA